MFEKKVTNKFEKEKTQNKKLNQKFTDLVCQIQKHIEDIDGNLDNVNAERLLKLCRAVYDLHEKNAFDNKLRL